MTFCSPQHAVAISIVYSAVICIDPTVLNETKKCNMLIIFLSHFFRIKILRDPRRLLRHRRTPPQPPPPNLLRPGDEVDSWTVRRSRRSLTSPLPIGGGRNGSRGRPLPWQHGHLTFAPNLPLCLSWHRRHLEAPSLLLLLLLYGMTSVRT